MVEEKEKGETTRRDEGLDKYWGDCMQVRNARRTSGLNGTALLEQSRLLGSLLEAEEKRSSACTNGRAAIEHWYEDNAF